MSSPSLTTPPPGPVRSATENVALVVFAPVGDIEITCGVGAGLIVARAEFTTLGSAWLVACFRLSI
jgi:hypothetical protein